MEEILVIKIKFILNEIFKKYGARIRVKFNNQKV